MTSPISRLPHDTLIDILQFTGEVAPSRVNKEFQKANEIAKEEIWNQDMEEVIQTNPQIQRFARVLAITQIAAPQRFKAICTAMVNFLRDVNPYNSLKVTSRDGINPHFYQTFPDIETEAQTFQIDNDSLRKQCQSYKEFFLIFCCTMTAGVGAVYTSHSKYETSEFIKSVPFVHLIGFLFTQCIDPRFCRPTSFGARIRSNLMSSFFMALPFVLTSPVFTKPMGLIYNSFTKLAKTAAFSPPYYEIIDRCFSLLAKMK